MSSPTTDLSRARLEFLLQSRWPAEVSDADGWLRKALGGRRVAPPSGSSITPVTIDTQQGLVAGFSWFAMYLDPAALVEAHDELAELITTLLEVPGVLERDGDHSGYWLSSRFAVETYAHDLVPRVGHHHALRPMLQVNVADAALAAAAEARARLSL